MIFMNETAITALYCRLSVEDGVSGESGSIAHQKAILAAYARGHGFPNPQFFIDDGYSGTTFDRPGMQRLLALAEAGLVGTVIVKDMSRFGRDYLKVGHYLELYFPSRDIRFIAVNDGVDTAGAADDFTPFRSLFNDFYAKDASRKIRAVLRAKGESGQHIGRAPYGYEADPAAPGRWRVDEKAAPVVRHIFALCLAGLGPTQIARRLEEEQVPTPSAHRAEKAGRPLPPRPCRWDESTVAAMLRRVEYTGCTCNFKTYSKSYKLKKRLPTPPEDRVVRPGTQPPLVSQGDFDRVQALRGGKRRPVRGDRAGLFSGLIYCGDCGARLHFTTCRRFDGGQDHYVCARYKGSRGGCTAHYVREAPLRAAVVEAAGARLAKGAAEEGALQKAWLRADAAARREAEGELRRTEARLKRLDTLIAGAYEAAVADALRPETCRRLAAGYERERGELVLRRRALAARLQSQEPEAAAAFFALCRRHARSPLPPAELIRGTVDRVEVFTPTGRGLARRQRVWVTFLPSAGLPLPEGVELVLGPGGQTRAQPRPRRQKPGAKAGKFPEENQKNR